MTRFKVGEAKVSVGKSAAAVGPDGRALRTFSELIALAGQREKMRGYPVVLDEEYAAGVERIVGERKPWTPRPWV